MYYLKYYSVNKKELGTCAFKWVFFFCFFLVIVRGFDPSLYNSDEPKLDRKKKREKCKVKKDISILN